MKQVSDGQATTGLNIMTDLITAFPNLRGVFADNLIQCQGASQAVAENKKGDTIKLVCFDADAKLIGYLKDGTIAALLLQDPYRMGYDGVKTALAASKGEKVPANVSIPAANLVHQGQHGPAEGARAPLSALEVTRRRARHGFGVGAPFLSATVEIRSARVPHLV